MSDGSALQSYKKGGHEPNEIGNDFLHLENRFVTHQICVKYMNRQK